MNKQDLKEKKSKSYSYEPLIKNEINDISKYESQINELKKELNDCKNQLNEEKEKNKKLNENDEEKNKNKKLLDENNELREKNKKLIFENNELKEKINNLKSEIGGLNCTISTLINNLNQKNIEIQKNNGTSKNNNPTNSENQNENKLVINFVIQGFEYNNLKHSYECNGTDLFVKIEEKLYEDFPVFKKYETYFEVNSKRIMRFETLLENNIKDKDEIKLFVVEDKSK